ncbi:MAG TPA: hypothetical protein DF383_11070 [Deltaproteobacteria bacterium]|nr:hypothetical protein [Deltaproteobacteria bacterium]
MSEASTCTKCREWLEAAFLGEPVEALGPDFQSHLDSCSECQAVQREYQALRHGMEVLAERPARQTVELILRNAEEMQERRHVFSWHQFWRWLLHPFAVLAPTKALSEQESSVEPTSTPARPSFSAWLLHPTTVAVATLALVVGVSLSIWWGLGRKSRDILPQDSAAKRKLFQENEKSDDELRQKGNATVISSGQTSTDQKTEADFETQLASAKEKLILKQWNEALEALLKAQQIHDTQEIRDLIALCRSHLRGDE